jgi:MFS family permease
MGLWASMHRGYWFVASLYLVLDAHLSAFQLVTIGVVQSIVAFVVEVPAGVVADAISRKWSLFISHVLMGSAIICTGLTTSFPLLVVTQSVWGVAWAFASGADVAWITDELNAPEQIDQVLARSEQVKSLGAAFGIVVFGALAWTTSRSTAICVTGFGIVGLSAFVTRIPELRFVRTTNPRVASWKILKQGIAFSKRDRVVATAFVATMFSIGGGGEGFNRMYVKQLDVVGFPTKPNPMLWFGILNLCTLIGGAFAMRQVEHRISQADIARRSFAAACGLSSAAVVLLAFANSPFIASAASVLVGVGLLVARAVSGIWVNQRVDSSIRATVHSLLRQAEYVGEIGLTFGLGVLARASSIRIGLLGSAVLFVFAMTTLNHGENRTHSNL